MGRFLFFFSVSLLGISQAYAQNVTAEQANAPDYRPSPWKSAKTLPAKIVDIQTQLIGRREFPTGMVYVTYQGSPGVHLCAVFATALDAKNIQTSVLDKNPRSSYRLFGSEDDRHDCGFIGQNGQLELSVHVDALSGGLIITTLYPNNEFHTNMVTLDAPLPKPKLLEPPRKGGF